ncbi:MAG: RdgB/HAM1 family non-canonical purine NTP pyrophosphatase [Bacteroidales bacterium]|nr:RdgB/HAM1 family non-canonical purine NTP pyrophosphatase [Bacteroidales bacterium]
MVNKFHTLVFATHNKHKLAEASAIAGTAIAVTGLVGLNCFVEIPETANSFSGNALQKARYIYEHYHCNCFADDTGLEVEALNGRPGVFSARYAGEKATYQENCEKLLREMNGVTNRKARFVTVVALILNGDEFLFEGEIKGEILTAPRGESGFGYDPLFKPDYSNLSFAEMSEEEKNSHSHRGIALKKMIDFLKNK